MPIYDQMSGWRVDPGLRPPENRDFSTIRPWRRRYLTFVCQRTFCDLLSSCRALSREARLPWVGEVTLSQELRTARSPRPHVLVGYQWSHTGLRPGRKTSHNRYIRSFVSHLPQIRTCTFAHTAPHIMSSLRDGSLSESALRLVPDAATVVVSWARFRVSMHPPCFPPTVS